MTYMNLIILIHCIVYVLHAEMKQDHTLSPIIVTAKEYSDYVTETGQAMTIIHGDRIIELPFDNIADVLSYVSGVDVQQRGAHGVQSDVSIRGSGFEQTLILLDGMSFNNPQTGHHNMDIPINLEDIERIEIIKGPGVRKYGANAMAGVINIISKSGNKTAFNGHLAYGEYDYYNMGAQSQIKTHAVSNRISFNKKYSSGHLPDDFTNFDIMSLSYQGKIQLEKHEIRFGSGYLDKDFGANQFYTDIYPHQKEQTKTFQLYSQAQFQFGRFMIEPQISWLQHKDVFDMEIGTTWYRNDHQSDVIESKLISRYKTDLGELLLGCEYTQEELDSSNLMNRKRNRKGGFIEQKMFINDFMALSGGISYLYSDQWGWEYWPGAEINLAISEQLNIFASVAKTVRIPTFTELYYQTPANLGNPNLNPEYQISSELGCRFLDIGFFASQISVFHRSTRDVIDWVRESINTPWQAENIGQIKTQGIEVGLTVLKDFFAPIPFIQTIRLDYTFLDANRELGPLTSKYALDHLTHQFHTSIQFDWYDQIKHTVTLKMNERLKGDSYIIMDTHLTYDFQWAKGFINLTNCFDEEYTEAGFAPMPGRWFIAGIRMSY